MTGKQPRIASWIDAAMQALAQTNRRGRYGRPRRHEALFPFWLNWLENPPGLLGYSDFLGTALIGAEYMETGGLVLLDTKPRVSRQR